MATGEEGQFRHAARPVPEMGKIDGIQQQGGSGQDKENRETWAPKRKMNRTLQDRKMGEKRPRVLFIDKLKQEDSKTNSDPDGDIPTPTRLEALRQQFKLKLMIPKTEKKAQPEEYQEEEVKEEKTNLSDELTEEYIDEILRSSDDDSEEQKLKIQCKNQEKTEDLSPNEKIRMETALKLLNMKESAHLWLGFNEEEEVPNYWARRSRVTLWKTLGGLPVTLEEMEQCYKNYGHLVVSLTDKFTREELKAAEVKKERSVEVQSKKTEQDCKICQVAHSPEKTECPKLANNPPEWYEFEQSLNDWKTTARAALVGFESLVCLPEDTKGEILNLSWYGKPDYEVKQNLEEMNKEWIENQELYKILKSRLMLLNKDSSLPLMVEFTFSSRAQGCEERKDHATSFLKIVQRIQEEYSGPVVVLSGPTVFLPGSTMEDYVESKLISCVMAKALNLIGKALGVATAKLWINTIPIREGEVKDKSMRAEALFGPRGTVSREYCRRLTEKLLKLARIFKEIQVTGERRRRSLPKMDREKFGRQFRQHILE